MIFISLSYLNLLVNDAVMKNILPELLAPAGSLEKLKVAINYGADAVYLGGLKFGLRSAAENFTYEQLKEGVEYAHARGAKVYVVLNGFLHDEDLAELTDYLKFLDEVKIDATIVSDLGVIHQVRQHTTIPVHLSTQASCLNVASAKFWKSQGCERVVLGREVSIAEAKKIKEEAQIEVEMFIHGSMCMAYSGNCVISNFTQGRDSNRGGCAHSCRFEYSITQENDEEKKKAFFMSSKDLNGLKYLQEYIDAGIDSVKVEGRMKSNLYAATISKVYSEALRYYKEHGNFLSEKIYQWETELKKVNHRTYASANLIEPAQEDTIFNERESDSSVKYKVAGNIIESLDNNLFIRVQNAFNIGDTLEILTFKGDPIDISIQEMFTLQDEPLERSKPSTIVKIPYAKNIERESIVRLQC